jgi:hypothetical protein
MSEPIDLGDGHTIRLLELHGHEGQGYCGAIVRHEIAVSDAYPLGFDEGAIHFDNDVGRLACPSGPWWHADSWEPLSLSPSLLCTCGDHGFIREGKWVRA